MKKIKSIKYHNHPVLGNAELDFTLSDETVADCIIIAGKNGTGKSQILKSIQSFCNTARNDTDFEFLINGKEFSYRSSGIPRTSPSSGKNARNYIMDNYLFSQDYGLSSTFADIAINFNAEKIARVTASDIDSSKGSRRSDENTPTQIEQLFVDIDSTDAFDFREDYLKAKENGVSEPIINPRPRMERFAKAFNSIFEDLSFYKVINKENRKDILFKKFGKELSIKDLSSGEKQIVYRGGFLLQNINSTRGTFVLIDEPETTLHPEWQKKILSFYRNIFRDETGQQTSQMFIVTHSPFIIHSEDKANTKIIVLQRDREGEIVVQDSPEYYSCDSMKAIEDAFNIRDFSDDKPTIYVEGPTDELYFKTAVAVSGISDFPFDFKWVGHTDDNGNEVNTGCKALTKAYHFLIAQKPTKLNICLFDSDTQHHEDAHGNVMAKSLPSFEENPAGIQVGIENALIVDNEIVDNYRERQTKTDAYGCECITTKLQKMALCNHICNALPKTEQISIFEHIIEELHKYKELYTNHTNRHSCP